jgi:hypothetical protein
MMPRYRPTVFLVWPNAEARSVTDIPWGFSSRISQLHQCLGSPATNHGVFVGKQFFEGFESIRIPKIG